MSQVKQKDTLRNFWSRTSLHHHIQRFSKSESPVFSGTISKTKLSFSEEKEGPRPTKTEDVVVDKTRILVTLKFCRKSGWVNSLFRSFCCQQHRVAHKRQRASSHFTTLFPLAAAAVTLDVMAALTTKDDIGLVKLLKGPSSSKGFCVLASGKAAEELAQHALLL